MRVSRVNQQQTQHKKIKFVRKNIAKILTVISEKRRDAAKAEYKGKKYIPQVKIIVLAQYKGKKYIPQVRRTFWKSTFVPSSKSSRTSNSEFEHPKILLSLICTRAFYL